MTKKGSMGEKNAKLETEIRGINIDPQILGANIRYIRKNIAKCSNQEKFYKMVYPDNVGKQNNVSKWERGKKIPTLQELLRIAHIGGISVETLATVDISKGNNHRSEIQGDTAAYTLRDLTRILFYVMPETLGIEWDMSRTLEANGTARGFMRDNKEKNKYDWEEPCISLKIPLSYYLHFDRIGDTGKYDVISNIDYQSEAGFVRCAVNLKQVGEMKKRLKGLPAADNLINDFINNNLSGVPDIPVRPFQNGSMKGFCGIGEKKRPDNVK